MSHLVNKVYTEPVSIRYHVKVPLRISIGDISKSLWDVTMCVDGHVKALSFLHQDDNLYRKEQKMVRF